MQVAILGAGAAGLAALRTLSRKPNFFHPTAFERLPVLGGLWNFNEDTEKDETKRKIDLHNGHAKMYQHLKTSIPKEIMGFPDFPFAERLPSHMEHHEVRRYLADFTRCYHLNKYIKYNKTVDKVQPFPTKDGIKWMLQISDTEDDSYTDFLLYDAVIICSGRFAKPYIPRLEDLVKFEGTLMHSCHYTKPSDVSSGEVLILGSYTSALDITLNISPHCKKIYLSHNKPRLTSPLPDNVIEMPGIDKVLPNGVIFTDGTQVSLDSIVLCTGYCYNFPFLSPECHIKFTRGRVTPLYKHILNVKYPTMAFMGIPYKVAPFIMFDYQSKFIMSALDGTMNLPSEQSMYDDIEEDYQRQQALGSPEWHTHELGDDQWLYYKELARKGNFEYSTPLVYPLIWKRVFELKTNDIMGYKQKSYDIISDNSFIEN